MYNNGIAAKWNWILADKNQVWNRHCVIWMKKKQIIKKKINYNDQKVSRKKYQNAKIMLNNLLIISST